MHFRVTNNELFISNQQSRIRTLTKRREHGSSLEHLTEWSIVKDQKGVKLHRSFFQNFHLRMVFARLKAR